MKVTLSTTEAAKLLLADEFANWTPAGAYALVEHLEELETETGEEIEIDVIALRCDFDEYRTLEDIAEHYSIAIPLGLKDYAAVQDTIRDFVSERGTLIEFKGGVIVSVF